MISLLIVWLLGPHGGRQIVEGISYNWLDGHQQPVKNKEKRDDGSIGSTGGVSAKGTPTLKLVRLKQ